MILKILSAILLFQNSIKHVEGFLRTDPVVVTKVGSFRGVRSDNGNYTMFLGIPYALINESFPFGESLPVAPLEGIFEANDDSVRCPQRLMASSKITGAFNCLHVNIHVPDSASPDNLLPVMMFLHGGAFAFGSAGRHQLGPEYLVKQDVIYVSIGYRVGPYGFMCLDIPEVPGNHGLRDQEKAFDWIKNNIETFGGDLHRITLFGQSSGALAVGLHLFTSTEKAYRNAILQSGSVFRPDYLLPSDPGKPFRLASKLGFETDNIYEALNFLSNVPPHEVIRVDDPKYDYRPCVEKVFPEVTAFLSDYPLNLKYEHIKGITIMQGFTTEENSYYFTEEPLVPNLFAKELTIDNHFNFDGECLDTAESIVRHFYIGDEEISENYETVDFLSDFIFIYPTIRMTPKLLEGGVDRVYRYVFSYDGARNYGKISRKLDRAKYPGAMHADDLGYIFSSQNLGFLEPSGDDRIVLDIMTIMWTNFAKYNDPTPETSKLIPVKWQPITENSPEYYVKVNNTLTAGKAYEHQRMNFWRLFYKTYHKYELGYHYTNGQEDPKRVWILLDPLEEEEKFN